MLSNEIPVLGPILFHELPEMVVFNRSPVTSLTTDFLIVKTVASPRHVHGCYLYLHLHQTEKIVKKEGNDGLV